MRCRDVQDLASVYIDGELDDARASALRGHLRECGPCLALVRGLIAVRDTAADLDTLDPPASLWSAVQRGLAEAEIVDAHRPRMWLYWQALRPRLLPAAVIAAATVTMAVWLWRQAPASSLGGAQLARATDGTPHAMSRGREPAAGSHGAPSGSPDRARPDGTAVAAESFDERMQREISAADQRYAATLAELRSLVDTERAAWPAPVAERLDARLSALAVERQRQRGPIASAAPDPRSRDALYAVYRAEIELLQNVALYGPDALGEEELP